MVSENIYKTFSNRVKELRLKRKPKMTHESLAAKLGHHESFISKIEGGRRLPTLYDAGRMEEILGAPGQLVPLVKEILDRKIKVKMEFRDRAARFVTSNEFAGDLNLAANKIVMIPLLNSVKLKTKKWDNPGIIDRWFPVTELHPARKRRSVYAITIQDDGLNAKEGLEKGTILIVDPHLKPHESDVVVIYRGENYLIRKYSKKRSKITLKVESTSRYEDVSLNVKEFKSQFRGVAISMQKTFAANRRLY